MMQEKRPLKRPRLGPPDVYPQEAKQKEDELTSTNVKHGFATTPQLSEEFGTARNCNVTASKVGAYFNAILTKKEELMTLPDSGRKKQQVNTKDNFWPVTARTKVPLDAWFKDLAGNKPLISLAKKAPSFNKKEEIFAMLCENQVSMQRATWFIKLSSAYTVAVSEAKIKKRQMPDPSTEWTGTLIKFMKDLINRMSEKPTSSSSSSSNLLNSSNTSTPGSVTVPPPLPSPANIHSPVNSSLTPPSNSICTTPPHDDIKTILKQWHYCTQLAKYMYEECLLDRHEFLNWIIDLLDKMRSQPSEDSLLRFFLPFGMQYMNDFVQSERLSRRLAYLVCKKLAHMLNSLVENKENQLTNGQPSNGSINIKKESSNMEVDRMDIKIGNDNLLSDYMNCPHHHDIILQLSAILQVITIECPTSLVWCTLGENRVSSAFIGSPLDHLMMLPSMLPMPTRCPQLNGEIRKQLQQAEENIRRRSKHAESRWRTDKWQNLSGNVTTKILSTLDCLDNHCFDKIDSNNSLDLLYNKIFPTINTSTKSDSSSNSETKDNKSEYDPSQDADTVKILCEWAVSWQRWGEHRAMAVAWLLDKRRSVVTSIECNDKSTTNDDRESVNSGNGYNNGIPIFQGILMDFLDNDAPVLEENGSIQNKTKFTNLVHLFSELIRYDVFCHDAYMCTLISRGDLLNEVSTTQASTTSITGGPISNKPSPNRVTSGGMEEDVFASMNFHDDSNVDDDLDKLLQHIKKEQNNAMDGPDSPRYADGNDNP